jgi:two-component system, chemotaxis family, chemotaxis protein CheY
MWCNESKDEELSKEPPNDRQRTQKNKGTLRTEKRSGSASLDAEGSGSQCHKARTDIEGVAPRDYARGGGDASPNNCRRERTMKVLIAEDDFTSRKLLQNILSPYGVCDIAVDGKEAVEAWRVAWDEGVPYDLICMDIMMPNMDGHEALTTIRELEREKKVPSSREVKVIMTTALGDPKNVVQALYKEGALVYLVKPIGKQKLLEEVKRMGLIG